MKRTILFLVLAVFSLNLICAEIDYTAISPQSLPLYTGSLGDPIIKIVYEDQNGQYVYVEYQGVLYVAYLWSHNQTIDVIKVVNKMGNYLKQKKAEIMTRNKVLTMLLLAVSLLSVSLLTADCRLMALMGINGRNLSAANTQDTIFTHFTYPSLMRLKQLGATNDDGWGMLGMLLAVQLLFLIHILSLWEMDSETTVSCIMEQSMVLTLKLSSKIWIQLGLLHTHLWQM